MVLDDMTRCPSLRVLGRTPLKTRQLVRLFPAGLNFLSVPSHRQCRTVVRADPSGETKRGRNGQFTARHEFSHQAFVKLKNHR